MEEVIKVALLGSDFNYIQKVCDKINKDRPTDVHPFSDLNDFLKFCMSEKPSIVGISVLFSHKSTTNFPKIFKMAMNVPTFSFYEKYNYQTDKLLGASSAEHKIRSPLTAHNLWMRISNIMKEDEKKQNSGGYDGEDEKGLDENHSFHLKGGQSAKEDTQASLNSILKALDQGGSDNNKEGTKFNNSKKPLSKDSNEDSYVGSTNQKDRKNPDKESENSRSETDGNENQIKIDSRDVRSIKNQDTKEDKPEKASPKITKEQSEELKQSDFDEKNKTIDKSESLSENSKNSSNITNKLNDKSVNKLNQMNSSTSETAGANSDPVPNSEGHISPNQSLAQNQTSPQKKGRTEKSDDENNQGLGNLLAELENSSTKNKKDQPQSAQERDSNIKNAKPFIPNELKKTENDKKNKVGNSKKNESPKDEKEKEFGAVKISDKDQMKKEERQRQKEKDRRDNQKKLNILKSSSELGLQSAYLSESTDNYQLFSVKFLSTFIVESGPFKGILVLATTVELGTEELVDDFRVAVIENLKNNNIQCEISKEYPVSMDVDQYQDVVKKFADFSINFSDADGNQQNVFFVSRESVRPSFQESTLPDMFEVDIKVIPPQTPVNFDAFVHLPRNKRFVRYLKEGRSLSLKQAKRHSEEEQKPLYLPKDQKDRFIAFFIKNTLNWDFTLHKKTGKKTA